MPKSTEDQVHLIANMLQSLGSDPTWQQESGLRIALPCSFSELDAWTSRMPDPDVHRVIKQVLSRMTFINDLAVFDPHDLEGLGAIAADDPRVPGFIAELHASWPRPEQVAEIVELYRCVARTIREMAVSRDNLPPDIPAATGLDAAAGTLGITVGDIAKQLASTDDLLDQLIAFVPGASMLLRVVAVSAPEINRLFSPSGALAVEDTVAPIVLSGATGEGFLQSRSGPPGEPGTTGAGLSTYLYRISLSDVAGEAGVHSLELAIANPATLNFAEAGVGAEADVFVITQGGLGTVAPARAEIFGGRLTLTFDPPIRAGQDSFFVGIAAPGLAHPALATIRDLLGNLYEIDSIVPG